MSNGIFVQIRPLDNYIWGNKFLESTYCCARSSYLKYSVPFWDVQETRYSRAVLCCWFRPKNGSRKRRKAYPGQQAWVAASLLIWLSGRHGCRRNIRELMPATRNPNALPSQCQKWFQEHFLSISQWLISKKNKRIVRETRVLIQHLRLWKSTTQLNFCWHVTRFESACTH